MNRRDFLHGKHYYKSVESSETELEGGTDMDNRLAEIRMERKETQRQIADVMGIKTIGGYCKKELGYTPVTLEQAHAVALHWGLTIEEIFFAEKTSA